MRGSEVRVRALAASDLQSLGTFRCSAGDPWEAAVEEQIRGPLPRRYLASPPRFDGRMLLGIDRDGNLLVVGAHHIEPTLVPDTPAGGLPPVAIEFGSIEWAEKVECCGPRSPADRDARSAHTGLSD